MLVHVMVLLLMTMPCTQAGDILRVGGGATGATGGTSTPSSDAAGINAAAATAQAHANAQDMLARNTMALQAVDAMQQAARAAAAGATNAGANPNFPGNTLPDVPNGLGVGGLDIHGAPTGANMPAQSLENARNIVTIQQTQQQALLYWNTFNVGSNTTVRFDQSAGGADVGTWIAFNQITDPSGNPTQILGSIEAQGQVYVINQNGIIFGGASEVNTHAMVASALPINNNLVTRGLLNNPDSEFLFSATDTSGAYSPGAAAVLAGKIGNVTVQAGARITAPTSSANVGGRVALIGPNVTNNGTISTPDGQTILAAGMQVGFDAHSSNDPSLRGLDVYVGSVGTYGGTATNGGLIEAARGSVLITGSNVNQNGFINSTTSAALNGRVDLLANYNAIPNTNYDSSNSAFGPPFVYQSGNSTGIVQTGAGSVIQILPEYASALKVVGTELALKSQVNMEGLGVHLGINSVVFAPNANVALSAGVWDLILRSGITTQDFVEADGQVYLDQGAVVNVAGSTAVSASVSDYILTVDLRAAELADSALQRNGSLRGQSVTVDLREHGVRADGTTWVGTPLANLTSYLGVIQRNVGQLTVAGGTVTIKAGESVVMQSGSMVDVSGGYQNYAEADVQTTRLLSNGTLINIADANPDVLYQGIFNPTTSSTDPRWGSTTGSTSQFAAGAHIEDAHSAGANGGSLAIYAPAMALDGSFKGSTITGPQQLETAPELSSLSLIFRAQQTLRTPVNLPFNSPTPPAITFNSGASGLPAANAFALNGSGAPQTLRQERRDAVVLSPDLLSAQGFGSLLVDNKDGDITVPLGITLNAAPTGTISLLGANVNIQGTLLAPGGSIILEAYDISPYAAVILASQGNAAVVPPVNPNRGKVTVGASARVSTAGLIINDRGDAPAPLSLAHQVTVTNASGEVSYVSTMQGGSISIKSYSADLAAGSVLDVSGGFSVFDTVTYDKGGAISIITGQDLSIGSLVGGQLTLNSTLLGYSGVTGGSLALQATTIQVGGSSALYAGALVLQPEFFSRGGFASFTLTGLGSVIDPQTYAPAVVIAPGAIIQPVVSSLQASINVQSGASSVEVTTLVRPEAYRNAATLDFEGYGVTNFTDGTLLVRSEIVMGAGAQIITDALGSVTMNGQTVEILGSIVAPGGSITVTGASKYPDKNSAPTSAFATVHLGAGSVLSTAGKTVLLQDPYGLRTGHVYAGGTLSVSGNIMAEAGAVLDVSGTSAILDLLTLQTGDTTVFTAGLNMAVLFPGTSVTQPVQQAQAVATRVDSNGGSLVLKGGEFLYSAATLHGQSGGSTAQGGSLTVESNRFRTITTSVDDKDITLFVAQDITTLAMPVFSGGQVIGKTLAAAGGGAITALGYFGVNSFQNGGFDSLTLAGNVEFKGAVDVTAQGALHIADGGVLVADALVKLTASYVALGRPLLAPIRDEELLNPYVLSVPGVANFTSYFSPTYGTGRLEVTADLIETGFLSLQNIGAASLTARQELRGNSYFDIAGDLTITAGQVYPTTASTFTITAYNYSVGGVAKNGSVTILSSGTTPEFPLSGGGRLNIYASTITQGGTLRAPFGTIKLGWDGTGTAPLGLITNTSVPVTQQITLKTGSVTSVSAIDPQTGTGVLIPYGIIKDGTNWIDPTGFDITGVGVPDKTIKVSGANVTTETGSSLDIRGGGELYGYRWVEGNGGTNDILDTNGSYAILPGYASFFAPVGGYATSGLNLANLGGDAGYTNSTLKVGDSIYLKAAPGLAEGVYTLLPARYALLPGAMLVTPDTSGTLTTAQVKPTGSLLTSGYMFNNLNSGVTGTIYQQFEVSSLSVVKANADYTDYKANVFIPAAQQRLNLTVTPDTYDAGYALLSALQTMELNGGLAAEGYQTGRGGRVDISSPLDIVLAAPGAAAQPGKLLLNTTLLSGWNAESLLIGGVRTAGTGVTNVTVRTGNLTLDNAGAPLTGKEIILVANQTVNLAANAKITQSGTQRAADALVVNGNGALVRVSGVATAQTSRTGVTNSGIPALNVAAGVQISGPSITLDSTNATSLDNSTILNGQSINLNSGRVSLLLDTPGSLQPGSGLVLGGTALASLQNTVALSLLSYSSLDLYGTGTFSNTGTLALHAGEIRGFNQGAAGAVNIVAQSILLDNSANGTVVGIVPGTYGSLNLTSATITIGQNALVVDQFATVTLNAASGLQMQGTGSFTAQNNLTAVTPFISAASSATQVFAAGGVLSLTQPAGPLALPTSLGLGAQISFSGASVSANTSILLPSGLISLTAVTGNLTVGGTLNAGGTAQTFFDTVRYTNAGQVSLSATLGNVILSSTSVVSVAAASAGGDAGLLNIFAGSGALSLSGTLLGQAGAGGKGGSLTMDVGSLASFNTLNTELANGGFTNSLGLRVRNGSVTIDGLVKASQFTLGVDQGSITVNGTIDASGTTGGSIFLTANGNVTLAAISGTGVSVAGNNRVITVGSTAGVSVGQTVSGANFAAGTYVTAINGNQITLSKDVTSTLASGTAVSFGAHLTVAGSKFDDAGKGGAIWLESGAQYQGTVGTGYVDIQSGTTLDLSVAAKVAGNATTVGTSAFYGQYSGTLHIRAPQTTSPDFIQVKVINGTLIDPSSIVIEGYKLYDKSQANVVIQAGTGVIAGATYTTATFATDASSWFGAGSANYNSMFSRLVSGNTSIMTLENSLTGGVVVIAPGIEISNRGGNITLGSTNSSAYLNDWDLSLASFHLGPKGAAGILTMRASGNLVLYNTISDGFQVPTTGNGAERMWLAPLTAQSNLRPVNAQSWSFRLVAGADFSAANYSAVKSLTALAANSGSVLLGKNAVDALGGNTNGDSSTYLTRLAINPSGGSSTALSNFFQVIRTGSGDINVVAGRDVQLLNQFATIYTAGVQVASNTTVFSTGDFVLPNVTLASSSSPDQGDLGAVQQLYPAQYSRAGGNVSVLAGNDIVHYTRDPSGNLLMDSQRELPSNWLMRRDYVNATGNYGSLSVRGANDAAASATWWVNFSNFFDGVATLGGGNVTLKAGHDVQNVSAHAVTNARAARGAATEANLLELGGGDVTVIAGRNIDGGIYYVERGMGTLQASGAITTNYTRAPSTGRLSGGTLTDDEALTNSIYQNTWLPTTLFVGKSSFNVSARGDVLLGPVANTMLTPQSITNRHWYKTYFSTYNDASAVNVSSLSGSITFRTVATLPQAFAPDSLLTLWMNKELQYGDGSSAAYHPWLRLVETQVTPFSTMSSVMPGTLKAVAYSGDINLVGNLNLSPSPTGTLELLAAGAVNGLSATGVSSSLIINKITNVWASSTINLSDASPLAIPSYHSPLSYYAVVLSDPTNSTPVAVNNAMRVTDDTFLNTVSALFVETGSTTGENASTQSKQALHAKGLLHANDTKPALIYAKGGNLSGLTLYSAKAAVVLAQQDITDIALYIQNVRNSDVSIVSSGRDIVAYNANSALRSLAVSTGNFTALGEVPLAGDIQISGPGSLQVLSGRDINLGTGSNNADGTGVGITSIGNGRNPYLPFGGADIVLAAGMGNAMAGLSGSNADFTTFITQFATSPAGSRYLNELATALGVASIDLNDPSLTPEQQKELALAVYYLVLRDAGRDHNDPDSPNFGTYSDGYAAIAALLPTTGTGSIQTQARDVRTKSGGDISILTPGGGLQLAASLLGDTLTPPGIITEAGGGISIFAKDSINIGISRIFTLRGGDIMIWSSTGDIAAGTSSKTVQSAPPTRVLIDPQSANVATDLAGLATGGGIGVLATVAGVAPANVDLIAPIGAVDAGDAGIRATGNLNIAATIVLNSANISVGGTSAGTPAAVSVAAPSLGGLAAASSSAAAGTSAANSQAPKDDKEEQALGQDQPSFITVQVIGYGGGDGGEDERKRRNDQPGE